MAQVAPGRRIVILFGPPGSGKGTQAKLLSGEFGIPHISTGDMLRASIEAGTEIGRSVAGLIQAGNLAADCLVNRIVEERVRATDCGGGYILDGYPRTRNQAETFRSLVRAGSDAIVVIYLRVNYNVVIDRLTGRRQCGACGSVYNLQTNPPRDPRRCNRDGSLLIWREDDRPDVIRHRLASYDEKTTPILQYFQTSGFRFVEEDGSAGTPQEIAGRLTAHVASLP